MEALSFLPEVAQSLQQDANANRIKKLLHFACHGIWEANPSKVAELDLLQLLEEVHHRAPTTEQLQILFTDAIKRINKKAEYTQVAELVLGWMMQLYSDDLVQHQPRNGTQQVESPQPQPQVWTQVQKIDYSPFDLRLDVVRQTNPLRAKMVLYAALFHPLEANDSSLAVLKQHSLDELLEMFFARCQTPEDVDQGLRAAAQSLPDASQGSQAAGALIQAMQSLFIYEQPPQYQPYTPGGLEDLHQPEAEDLDWMDPIGANGQGAEESVVIPDPPPVEPIVEPESPPRAWVKLPPPQQPVPSPPPPIELDDATQTLLDKRGSDLMVTIENTLSELGNQLDERLQDEDPQEYLTLKHQVLRGFLRDVESSSAIFMPILRKWEESEQRLLHPDQELQSVNDPQSQDPYTSMRRVLVHSPLTQRKFELDQEIMRLVKRSIMTVKNDIDTALRQLGTELEDSFQDRSLTEGLTLKYTALRAFVHEVERISSKFSSMLTKMEEAERRLFGIE